MDKHEQFYNEFLTSISDSVDENTMNIVAHCLSITMNKYEITQKCTDVVRYEEIPACVKTYLVTRKIEGVAMSSLNLYKLRLQQFFTMVKKPIEEITANDIRLFMYYTQEQTKCSDRTLDGTRSIISTFFKWANVEGYIHVNPCAAIKPIKYTKKERGYLSEIELETLRSACDNLRNKAIIETLYSTGCRVSELIHLKIADVDFNKKEVILFGKGSKYRQSYINTRAEIAIKQYLDSRSDDNEYLFVSLRKPYNQITKAAVEKIVRDLGKNCGIKQKVFPHLLRHTVATMGIKRDIPITEIQKMLGHAKIETTLIYVKIADESVKNSHKKYIV